MEASVWRKISRAICFVGGMIPPPSDLVLLEDIRIEHIGRTLPLKQSHNIVGSHYGHLGTRLQRSGSEMRRQNNVGALEAGVDEGFIFVDVESGAGNFLVFEGRDESGFVHDGSARGVDKEGGRFHTVKLGSVEQGARLR